MQKITEMTYPNVIAENACIDEKYSQNAQELAYDMIREFLDLCTIPHPSRHVEKMREYLIKWGHRNGLETHLDDSGCVYIDVPASVGCEDMPKVILQSHFDMVAVGASTNKDYIPTETPIRPYFDHENNCIHTHWQTSLGADDGQGIAASMAIAKLHRDPDNGVKHGPLRLLFTYDEEVTMQGVKNLSEDVIDAKYLINLDSIYVGLVLASSAGAYFGTFTKNLQLVNAEDKTHIFQWEIGGFTGGHSGEDIHKGRGSTLQMMLEFLKRLKDSNIGFNFCDTLTGTFMNAIPAKMKMKIIVSSKDLARVRDIAEKVFDEALEKYTDPEKAWHTTSDEVAYATPMLSRADTAMVVKLLNEIPDGIITYLDGAKDWKGRKKPETSSNIGRFEIKGTQVKIDFLFRSAVPEVIDESLDKMNSISEKYRFDFTTDGTFFAWPRLEKNPLNDLFIESYKKVCGFEGASVDIHSGLECGYLYHKFPNLIMASIGCDLVNEHTVKETLFTKSIPAYFASLLYVLEHLGTGGMSQ